MTLLLKRTYHHDGTNGQLFLDEETDPLCFTIELPWHENEPQKSCIPEGTYVLQKRYSAKFKSHLQIINVPGRELILIHPANDALLELRGCIAPNKQLTGDGTGSFSREAFGVLMEKVNNRFLKKEIVLLIISKDTGPGC